MDDRPRRHHYAFAHQSLPAVARRIGPQLVAAGRAGALAEGLARHWDSLGKELPPDDRLAGDELAAQVFDTPGYDVVVVRFPRPRGVTEAHLAAICVPSDAGPSPAEAPVRYLTLEHSVNLFDASASTVLGEWTADGTHVNYGEGPPADDLPAFVAAVTGHLTPR